jgi:hypothetical protein
MQGESLLVARQKRRRRSSCALSSRPMATSAVGTGGVDGDVRLAPKFMLVRLGVSVSLIYRAPPRPER